MWIVLHYVLLVNGYAGEEPSGFSPAFFCYFTSSRSGGISRQARDDAEAIRDLSTSVTWGAGATLFISKPNPSQPVLPIRHKVVNLFIKTPCFNPSTCRFWKFSRQETRVPPLGNFCFFERERVGYNFTFLVSKAKKPRFVICLAWMGIGSGNTRYIWLNPSAMPLGESTGALPAVRIHILRLKPLMKSLMLGTSNSRFSVANSWVRALESLLLTFPSDSSWIMKQALWSERS